LLDEFREAYLNRGKTGERAAYIGAVLALGGVLLHLEEQLALSDVDPAYMWFIDLTRELEDLETGIIPPVFRCRGGRKGLSTVEWLRRFAVVEAIELFHATGMKYDDAARRVILAYKPGVSASEALSWCKEFKKRTAVKNKEAAELYEDMMAMIPTSGAQDLRRQIAILFAERGLPAPNFK
jgi:hypothetical protein